MFHLDNIDFAYEPAVIFRAQPRWSQGREPVLRRMPNGELLCLIYTGGPTEPHDDNVIAATRSNDDGQTWSEPEILFQHDTRGVWGPELFTEGNAPCIFVHTLDAASHYMELKTFRSFSTDNGHTWSEPTTLPGGGANCSVRQGVVLANGDWVFPVYWQEASGSWNWKKTDKTFGGLRKNWHFRCGALRSTDRGQTFTLHGYIRDDSSLWEPNIIETTPNHLIMFIRQSGAPTPRMIYRSDSTDGGLTWSNPHPTTIPNASSKITLVRVNDAIVLLHNPNPDQRSSLSLWASYDNCDTWPVKIDLARSPQKICYPHALVDHEKQTLYVASDAYQAFYLQKIPFADFQRP